MANERVPPSVFEETLREAIVRLKDAPLVVEAEPPALVVGDLHGDVDSLVDAMEVAVGECGDCKTIVFIGDYVDRGPYGAEVLQAVASLLVSEGSNRIVPLRGNHETMSISMKYGYARELIEKYGSRWEDLYGLSLALFSLLPYVAVIGDVVVIHGGIPQGVESLEDLRKVRRGLVDLDPRKDPLEYQLVWNDPADGLMGFAPSSRGEGIYLFGPDVTSKFLNKSKKRLIIRGHTPPTQGFAYYHGGRVLNVFTCRYYGFPISVAIVGQGEVRPIVIR